MIDQKKIFDWFCNNGYPPPVQSELNDLCDIIASTIKSSEPVAGMKRYELARIIHDAKIRCCWDKTKWDERRAVEPWNKPNQSSPNQPWHDVALAQADAVIAAAPKPEKLK